MSTTLREKVQSRCPRCKGDLLYSDDNSSYRCLTPGCHYEWPEIRMNGKETTTETVAEPIAAPTPPADETILVRDLPTHWRMTGEGAKGRLRKWGGYTGIIHGTMRVPLAKVQEIEAAIAAFNQNRAKRASEVSRVLRQQEKAATATLPAIVPIEPAPAVSPAQSWEDLTVALIAESTPKAAEYARLAKEYADLVEGLQIALDAWRHRREKE